MRELKELTLATLAEIDGGRLAIAFKQALQRCAMDCDDRPGEKKTRSVTIQVAVEPVLDQDGLCEDCDVQVTIADSVPKRKSKAYNCTLRKGGKLLFHPDSLDDHEQETFDFKEGAS